MIAVLSEGGEYVIACGWRKHPHHKAADATGGLTTAQTRLWLKGTVVVELLVTIFIATTASALVTLRIIAFVASFCSAGVYCLIGFSMHRSMVRNFDMIIRKQTA